MDGRKKVLIVITQSVFGGAQRYVFDLARSLPRETYDVVVAAGGSGILFTKLAEASIRTIPLTHLQRHVSLTDDFKTMRELSSIIRRERPDVLHLNSSKIGILGSLIGRFLGVPRIIFTAHGWEFNNTNRSLFSRILIKILSILAVYLSHTTIAVSNAVRNDIAGFILASGKLVVIENGIAPFAGIPHDKARHEIATRLALTVDTSSEIWVGTVAELHPVKGLPYALRALKSVIKSNPAVRYIIIGEGSERRHLEKMIVEEGLTHHVHLLGFYPDAAQILSAFDIFLLPSRSEALGYAILEAGNASLPTIASHVGGIPEVIEDTRSGYLIGIGDVALMSARLEELAGNPELRKKIGVALHERVRKLFSLERMVEKTEAEYC